MFGVLMIICGSRMVFVGLSNNKVLCVCVFIMKEHVAQRGSGTLCVTIIELSGPEEDATCS